MGGRTMSASESGVAGTAGGGIDGAVAGRGFDGAVAGRGFDGAVPGGGFDGAVAIVTGGASGIGGASGLRTAANRSRT